MSQQNLGTLHIRPIDEISHQYREIVQEQNFQERQDYLEELLCLQIQLNKVLLINTMLTDQFIKQSDQANGKTSSSQGSTLASGIQKMISYKNQLRPHDTKIYEKKKNKRSYPKAERQSSASEYEPSQDDQSKNVPKNYGKAILNFIKKNQSYTKRVLNYLRQDYSSFQEFLKKFRNSINTIAQLRSLWLEEKGNNFAKALRIITMQYLRKFSLTHIFNSRVQNFGKHIKYRQKIVKAVSKPQQFTQMKDY